MVAVYHPPIFDPPVDGGTNLVVAVDAVLIVTSPVLVLLTAPADARGIHS